MAGIGFELKKLFSKRGIFYTLRAYGYAGVVCTGPMILGVLLLLGTMLIAEWAGCSRLERELLVCMLTYALLSSLVVTSLISVLVTRYTADMIYIEDHEAVMPSFYGSLALLLPVGGLAYGIFLWFSGAAFVHQVLSWILFMVLIVVWTEINYLTAIKDYKSIMFTFAFSLLAAFGIGLILIVVFKISIVTALMTGVCCGYGIMMVWYFYLLYRYFPEGFGSIFRFIKWFDLFPQLSFIGFFITAGMFGHLIIMWLSPLQVQVKGLFVGAPEYDVPALVAFFSILVTTINFVTSVEVSFYPKYKDYFSLLNDGGNITAIDAAETGMLHVMQEEFTYLALKQLFATIIFIVLGTIILPATTLGFSSEMLGIYRVLCVGYAFYAVGNSIMLILLYFSDNTGALISATVFVLSSNIATILLMNGSPVYYGFGLVIGGAAFCFTAWIRLSWFTYKLKHRIIAMQKVLGTTTEGFLTRLSERLEERAVRSQKRRRMYYEKHTEQKEVKDSE